MRLVDTGTLIDPHHPSADKERQWASAHRVQWLSLALPGDGTVSSDQRRMLKRFLIHDAEKPVLVHCAAGSSRIGIACALVRVSAQGWTAADAVAEMQRFGFTCKNDSVYTMLCQEARSGSGGCKNVLVAAHRK